jgi:hypothetical protein
MARARAALHDPVPHIMSGALGLKPVKSRLHPLERAPYRREIAL